MEGGRSTTDGPAPADLLPVVALRDLVFFPSMVLPLLVGRPLSVAAIREALEGGGGRVLLLAQRDASVEDPGGEALHPVGTIVRILQATPLDDGTYRVVFEGIERARAMAFTSGGGALRAETLVEGYGEIEAFDEDPAFQALLRTASRSFREYVHLHPELPAELAGSIAEIHAPLRLAHTIAGHLVLPAERKQPLLEAATLEALYRELVTRVERELEILQIEESIDREMRRKIDEDRKQHYLQEQLRVIHRELGGGGSEWTELEERIASTPLPEAARERAQREFDRLQRMGPGAPEAPAIRNYLEWILALPWEARSIDHVDVAHAREVLESAHFGLDEVKDRILDHMAVLSLVGQLQGPILCLVGPPGVGKTSLGKSIARALDRRFVRVALGGVRDEAEIRGHRRTYVGSLPGRILQGMRKAGTRNPVFLLDEVDKLAKDGHGDPSSALLEVLDPEQNRSFQDHYFELDFDLSEVLWVATANTLADIPEPLRDRMEIIRIPGYLDIEKRGIARDFLIPEQLRAHGLPPERVRWDKGVLDQIVDHYTREAGVRELDRLLARIARKLARRVAEEGSFPDEGILVGEAQLHEYLGPARHLRSPREGAEAVGIATGLAWTSVGGEILEVEVSLVPGQGLIQLTGTLGEVMKESAVAALTYARSRARELGLRADFHRDVDLHLHIPEGATPKDGPSAGITIATALISALTGTPTRADVAMTGEITLRGRILPVGGIREKAVAALRHGITRIILPIGNLPDVETLPPAVRERLQVIPVERMDEVLAAALATPLGESGGGARLLPELWAELHHPPAAPPGPALSQ